MLELDFAFLNMMNEKRQGLAARKFFLDRLAPIFYSPRVNNLIQFRDLGIKGCNVFLPLGQANWKQLEENRRTTMLTRSEGILQEYELPRMAADRRLNKLLEITAPMFPALFGENFIKVLAAVLVRNTLERHAVNKLIVVGELPELIPLLEHLGRYLIPISVQNTHPARFEYAAYKLLYERGLAVSNSYICPDTWEKGDLILLFDAACKGLALAAPHTFYFELINESRGLAPGLENDLNRAGMDDHLQTLAPILESCLYTKAGIKQVSVEKVELDFQVKQRAELEKLIEAGDEMGLWEAFCHQSLGCVS